MNLDSSEEGGCARMNAALHIALRMVRSSRTVSDFLFDSILENVFHRDYALAPASLATSLTFDLKQTLRLEQVSPSNLPQAWRTSSTNEGLVHSSNDRNESNNSKNDSNSNDCNGCEINISMMILYVPVVSVPPFVMGYAWFLNNSDENKFCLPASPFKPPCASRYVFNTRTGEALLVACGGKPTCLGFHWSSTNANAKDCSPFVLGVPAAPYEWPHLPTTVIWMMSALTVRGSVSTYPITGAGAVADSFNSGMGSFYGSGGAFGRSKEKTSHVPWRLDAAGALPDGTHAFRIPEDSPESDILGTSGRTAAGFTTSALRASLADMVALLSGSFHFYGLQFDAFIGMLQGACLPPPMPGKCNLVISKANPAVTALTRERFALVYYMMALSMSTDLPLHTAAPPASSTPSSKRFSPPPSTASAYRSHRGHGDVMRNDNNDSKDPLSDEFWIDFPENALHLGPTTDPSLAQSRGHLETAVISGLPDSSTANPNPLTKSPLAFDFDTGNPAPASLSMGLCGEAHDANPMFPIQFNKQPNEPSHNNVLIDDIFTSTRASSHPVPLAPQPILSASASQEQEQPKQHMQPPRQTLQSNPQGRGAVDEQTRREQAQARRVRNRMSAARSNERKKEFLANLQRETEESKRKVAELTVRKLAIESENELLKAELHFRSASTMQSS